MLNNKIYPFERNRFYSGKMLMSSDFEAEQDYFNNKRRFLNKLIYGNGILCGLGVYNLDDLSLMIESGAAIDAGGREIVVEKSVVKKLSSIEGFDDIKGDKALLCIKYSEEPVQPAYSAANEKAEHEYEYNRLHEDYKIFVMNALEPKSSRRDEGFITVQRIYADNDFEITISVPSAASSSAGAVVAAEIRKLSSNDIDITFSAVLQIPSFTSEDGAKEISIVFDGVNPQKNERVRRCCTIYPSAQSAIKTNIIAKSNFLHLSADGVNIPLNDDYLIPVEICEAGVSDIILRELGKRSLESRTLSTMDDYIALAEIKLLRSESAYVIESVVESTADDYIRTSSQHRLESVYRTYFTDLPVKNGRFNDGAFAEDNRQRDTSGAKQPYYATGVCEIPLGIDIRPGSVVYSDEIMHGLGKGDVFVDIGVELISDTKNGTSSENVIYGDARLFGEETKKLPDYKSAVKVMSDKGTFMAAIKLLSDTNYISLKFRWVAIKFLGGDNAGEFSTDAAIVASPSTIVLSTRESFCINVKFNNMKPASLHYDLLGKDSGEITPDGIYTAPAKDGVYEIKISCAENPLISTYAYAVVKKKGIEE